MMQDGFLPFWGGAPRDPQIEMLRVDRCRDIDEQINFWARSGS